VLVTVSDKKQGVDTDGDNEADYYTANVLSANDYYPFGWSMPGRKFNSGDYRFGFNGQEQDTEWGGGQAVSFKFRIHDPRIGKFLSVDPLASEYPWYTPYQFAGNSPILNLDLEGLEPLDYKTISNSLNDGKAALGYKLTVFADQPGSGGDRDTYESRYWTGVDVGHSFVKLEKINTDGTITSQTFGFYPINSVNPARNTTSPGQIKDNSSSPSEVSSVFNLSEKEFNQVLDYVKKSENNVYDLDTYNCTDFVIGCAKEAGVVIPDTEGKWPLGSGSNPGDLGEDLKILKENQLWSQPQPVED